MLPADTLDIVHFALFTDLTNSRFDPKSVRFRAKAPRFSSELNRPRKSRCFNMTQKPNNVRILTINDHAAR